MNVIRHDYIVVYKNGRIFYWYLMDIAFRNQANRFGDGKPVPYDRRENSLPLIGTDGYEIGTVCTVIIFRNAVLFSLANFQTRNLQYIVFVGNGFAAPAFCKGTGDPSPTVRTVGWWDGRPVPYGKDGGKDFLLQYESRGTNNQIYRSSLGYLMGTAIWVM